MKTAIEKLKYEPDKQGKPLSQELQGYRSIRAVPPPVYFSGSLTPRHTKKKPYQNVYSSADNLIKPDAIHGG